jgi:outer membrane protein OmpA-like peptidoglycan-associated protein
MTASQLQKIRVCAVLFVFVVISSSLLAAENVKIEGFVVANNGDEMVVKFGSGAELTFVLTENTEVSTMDGIPKEHRSSMYATLLIPGLKVQVEGMYNEQRQVIATKVKFKGDDLEQARTAQAATEQTKMQAQANKEQLEAHNEELETQNAALKQQQTQLTEQQAKIAANKAAIDAAIARFGQLDDYYIFDELTVYFGNGQVKVDPKYEPQLLALAEKAKTIEGYVVEVRGFASSAGSVSTNQKLSEQRSQNVTNILLQKGNVPLTRMLAPGALGESQQVGNDKNAEGQAENRRVVVRVLQNKAIAGS